jgi:hypothetical protein
VDEDEAQIGVRHSVMVRAVLFDLFETLVTESETLPARASRLGDALGLESYSTL